MANPRKFSEKIALHNQKQAEETAAFEAIMREVSALPKTKHPPHQHLNIVHPNLGAYRGGSLPNVNQIANNNSIDLQSALHSLEDMKQRTGLVERLHRDRGRQLQRHPPQRVGATFSLDKRVDCSPYGSPFLSPPPDGSWRRTHSDSSLHTSAMSSGNQSALQQPLPQANTPPSNQRLNDTSPENSLSVESSPLWDPKKQLIPNRPKSCEVPGINIFPSPEQDGSVHSLPVSSNTGSLPDLTNLHFPSPMVTPLDAEDQHYQSGARSGNLSPTSAQILSQGSQSSPGQRRRQSPAVPSPLVLPPQLHSQAIPQGCIDMLRLAPDLHLPDNRLHHQQFRPHQYNLSLDRLTHTHLPILIKDQRIQRKQCLHSKNQSSNSEQPVNVTQYRNGQAEHCPQSPTSPHSQQSYSPSQSPRNLSPSNMGNNSFNEDYYLQQQQQTTALQHQFEQFNMLPDGTLPASNGTVGDLYNHTIVSLPGLQYSQSESGQMVRDQEFVDMHCIRSHFNFQPTSPQQPSSPQHHPSPSHHSQQQQLPSLSSTQASDQQIDSQSASRIPDIILTGLDWFPLLPDRDREPGSIAVEDNMLRQDFAKELGNAMADNFDADLFPSDEALKDGLDPLDFAGLQMLTDATLVADPATEDTLRLDNS